MKLFGQQSLPAGYFGGVKSRFLRPKIKPRLAQPTTWSLVHQTRFLPPVEVCPCDQRHYAKHVNGTYDVYSSNGTQANMNRSVTWTGHAVWNPVCLHGTYISSLSSVIRLLFHLRLCFLLLFFFFFSFLVFLAFHFFFSPPPPNPSLNFLLTATNNVDESGSSVSIMTRVRTGRPVKQGSILVEAIDFALRHYIRVIPDIYGVLSQ